MNIGKLCLAAITAILVSCSAASQRQGSDGVIDVAAPVIPDTRVLLTDFGAVGDGESLATEAFEKGMAALEEKGGGHLDVPAGIWLTGPITLRSHTDLHLDDNAIIVFSSDEDLYPIIDTNFEGLDVRRCLSPINADGVTDISITGRGIIDGSGDAWREVKKRKVSDDQWKVVLERGGVLSDDGKVWFPNEGYKKARATAGSLNKPADDLDELEIKTFLRPVMVSIRNSERILLEGCTFQNSPCWNLHPLWCKDLTVRNVIVRNPHYSANGDGIDIDGCENVLIENSSFDVGDDAICVKSGKDEDGRHHARPTRNLTVRGCTVYHGHGGFVVGSEMSGGVENVTVTDCKFIGTDVGLRFKSTRGRGGVVRNITCSNIYMKDIVSYGIIFNLYYAGVAASDMSKDNDEDIRPVDETTPEFRDITISGITCAGAGTAMLFNGLPEMPVGNVTIDDCKITAKEGITIAYSQNVTISGLDLTVTGGGERVTVQKSTNVQVSE